MTSTSKATNDTNMVLAAKSVYRQKLSYSVSLMLLLHRRVCFQKKTPTFVLSHNF